MHLYELAAFLHRYLRCDRYPAEEQGGVFRGSERVVRRLGVALEPTPELADWVRENALDALWLHRPWKLDLPALPPEVGVLFHHLPFDETLTLGENQLLATALPLRDPAELGHKQAEGYPPRAIGMLGGVPARSVADWRLWAETEFGGLDQVHEGQTSQINRAAVVGAMNEVLIREAAQRGAQLYLTGAYRRGAQRAVEETGLTVFAVGHERSERWGVDALAGVLRVRFPGLIVHTLK